MKDELSKHFLTMVSPTIVLHRGCEDYCPKWILNEIRLERIVETLKGNSEKKASDLEAFAYLMTASFHTPFTTTWQKIYFYLFNKLFPEKARELGINASLYPYQEKELEKLKKWIYKKRKEREAERLRKIERNE